MFRIVLTFICLILSQTITAQLTYVQSDSIDVVALKWLNVYRAYHKVNPVTLDPNRKTNAKVMSKNLSDSLATLKPFTMRHTKEFCAEVLCVNTLTYYVPNSCPTNLTQFIITVFKQDIKKLTIIDMVIINAIYQWDQSTKGHKEIILNKKLKTGYFSMSYFVTDTSSVTDTYSFGFSDKGYFKYSYSASCQFSIPDDF